MQWGEGKPQIYQMRQLRRLWCVDWGRRFFLKTRLRQLRRLWCVDWGRRFNGSRPPSFHRIFLETSLQLDHHLSIGRVYFRVHFTLGAVYGISSGIVVNVRWWSAVKEGRRKKKEGKMRIRFVNSIYTLHTLSHTHVNTCTYTHTYTCYCMPLFINI